MNEKRQRKLLRRKRNKERKRTKLRSGYITVPKPAVVALSRDF